MHAGTGAPLKTSTNPDSDISPPSSDLLPASCASFASIFDVEAVSPHAGVTAPSSERTLADEGVAFSDEFVSPTSPGKAQFTQRIPGRLKAFIDQWRSAHAPAWILDIIQAGFLLPFKGGVTPPRYHNDRNHWHDPGAEQWAADEIERMLHLGAVELSDEVPHCVMPLRDARKGSWTAERPAWRLCHNQRFLNRYMVRFKFKLDSLREFAKAIGHGDFLFAIDLTSAYTHILIHPKHRRFIGF